MPLVIVLLILFVIFTKKEVAKHLKVSVRTVDNWMEERAITYAKKGHVVRFSQEDIDRFLSVYLMNSKSEVLSGSD